MALSKTISILNIYSPKNIDLSILIGYYKLNEFGGQYLFNRATNALTSDYIASTASDEFIWVYESYITDDSTTETDFLYCVEEN